MRHVKLLRNNGQWVTLNFKETVMSSDQFWTPLGLTDHQPYFYVVCVEVNGAINSLKPQRTYSHNLPLAVRNAVRCLSLSCISSGRNPQAVSIIMSSCPVLRM